MFSSVRTEGRSESFAGQQSKRKKERERGKEKRIIFWVGVMDWMIYNLGYKGKSQEGIDRTGNLDTVLCQHHETVGRESITTLALRAKGSRDHPIPFRNHLEF